MIQSLFLFAWLALCAAQDIRQRQIANPLTLGAFLLALVYLLWSGTTWLGATPAEVRANPAVIEAYLGGLHHG